jgi:hypothetical protein
VFAINPAPDIPDPEPYPHPQEYPENPIPVCFNLSKVKYFY